MNDITESVNYRVIQYNFNRERGEHNIPVPSFDGLVTHHPMANFDIRMDDGLMHDAEPSGRRDHAFIDGEFQEIEVLSTRSSNGDQILLIEDFILEDPSLSRDVRNVDVSSPATGYVADIILRQGLIDIHNEKNGYPVARIRHMGDFVVKIGDSVQYG